MKSSFFSLNSKDLIKGLFVAVLTAVLASFSVAINDGTFPTVDELKDCGLAGLAAGVAYLGKNLVTNSDDKLLKKEK